MSIDLAYTPLSLERSLDHLERETLRFVDVAERSPLVAHVPAYPAFTVETLSAHIGKALRTFDAILSADSDHGVELTTTAPRGPQIVAWVHEGLAPLLTRLREVPP